MQSVSRGQRVLLGQQHCHRGLATEQERQAAGERLPAASVSPRVLARLCCLEPVHTGFPILPWPQDITWAYSCAAAFGERKSFFVAVTIPSRLPCLFSTTTVDIPAVAIRSASMWI